MKKKKLLTLIGSVSLILVLAALTFMAACQAPPPAEEEKPPTPPVGEPQYGGVLRICINRDARSLGFPPEEQLKEGQMASRCALETLCRIDEVGQVAPWLATGWEVAPDLKSITLTLRTGVKFHDGTDFNAEAAKFNLDIYRLGALNKELKEVESVDVIDDYTVRLNLSAWDNTTLANLALPPGAMISPTAYQAHGKEWAIKNPVGTGPFKFVSWERDASAKFERFDGYWQKGKPYLDGVEFVIIADPVTAMMAFQKADIDVLVEVADLRSANDLLMSGKYVSAAISSETQGMAGDSRNADSPFADIRVRQAVEYAINKKELCDALGYGFWVPINQTAFSPTSWTYNPDVKGCPYNPEKARQLLAEAGYPDGFETTLFGLTTYSLEAITAYQAYLAEVGIKAEIEIRSPGGYFHWLFEGWKNGILVTNFTTGQTPEEGFLARLRTWFHSGGPGMASMLKPDDVDEAIELGCQAPDFESKKNWMHEVNRLVFDEYHTCWALYQIKSVSLMYPEVHDVGLFTVLYVQWTPEDAWLSK